MPNVKIPVTYVGFQLDADDSMLRGFPLVNEPSGTTVTFKPGIHIIVKNKEKFDRDMEKANKEKAHNGHDGNGHRKAVGESLAEQILNLLEGD